MLPPAVLDMRRPYKILCLDGGGVRGIMTATILNRIVQHDPDFMNQVKRILSSFYFFFLYYI
jgi:patatin-like phospholipase/acyl hydrolase